jgi:hypothetical protein
MKILFAIILFGLIASINAKIYTKNIPETNYLFSYFYNDEKDGLRLAYSTDGLHFAVMRYNFNIRVKHSFGYVIRSSKNPLNKFEKLKKIS